MWLPPHISMDKPRICCVCKHKVGTHDIFWTPWMCCQHSQWTECVVFTNSTDFLLLTPWNVWVRIVRVDNEKKSQLFDNEDISEIKAIKISGKFTHFHYMHAFCIPNPVTSRFSTAELHRYTLSFKRHLFRGNQNWHEISNGLEMCNFSIGSNLVS